MAEIKAVHSALSGQITVSERSAGEQALVDASRPLRQAPSLRELLLPTDGFAPRALEDLVISLLNKGVIAKTDLPTEVWQKINARRIIRGEAEV